jgi:hypothetical protein
MATAFSFHRFTLDQPAAGRLIPDIRPQFYAPSPHPSWGHNRSIIPSFSAAATVS